MYSTNNVFGVSLIRYILQVYSPPERVAFHTVVMTFSSKDIVEGRRDMYTF